MTTKRPKKPRREKTDVEKVRATPIPLPPPGPPGRVTLEELNALDYGLEYRFSRHKHGATPDQLIKHLKKLALSAKQESIQLAAIQYQIALDGCAPKQQATLEHQGAVSFTVKHESEEPVRKPEVATSPAAIEDDLDG
jgi:hypothetical protein